MRDVFTKVRQVRDEIGEPLIYVSISGDETPAPEPAVRKLLVEGGREIMALSELFYVVLESDGLKGSVLRSAMAGMMLLSKNRREVRVVGSLQEVLQAVAPKLKTTPEALLQHLEPSGVLRHKN